MYPLKNNYPNIGLLTGSLSSNYHEGIVSGAHQAAMNLPINLLIFSGGPIHTTNPLVQSRDQLFDIIDPSLLDAIIIPMSSLTRYMTKKEINDLVSSYSHIPIISVGTSYEGCINVMPDYRGGLEQLMKHYIVDHGYKRIVLQRGPKNHASSNLRMSIYKSILKKYNIPFDASLVFYGDLERNSTNEFAKQFDARNVDCDAIIAINSNATLLTIDKLKQYGISVPEDVAFAGMTSINDEYYSTPELTVLNEDFHALGKHALEAAYKSLNKTLEKHNILIPMDLTIGSSCGCDNHPISTPLSLNGTIDTSAIKSVYDEAISSGNYDSFLNSLYNYLSNHHTDDDYNRHLQLVKYYYLKFLKENNANMSKSDCLEATDAFLRISSSVQSKALRFRRHETMYYINFLRDIGNVLNSSYDLSIIEKHVMPTLNINDCYINLFDTSDSNRGKMKNIIAIKSNVTLPLTPEDLFFKTDHLLPTAIQNYDQPYSLLIFPLIFRSQYYGNLIVNYDAQIKGSAFEALETLISTTVMNELQLQDLIEAHSRFDELTSYDSLTGLPNRSMLEKELMKRLSVAENKPNTLASLLLINIDEFKKVNDALGHNAGDELLQRFADSLRSLKSPNDYLARVSNDEFALFINDIDDISGVQQVLAKISNKLSNPFKVKNQLLYLTVCIGIAMFPGDGSNNYTLIKAATNAMHKAKASGPNKFMFYDTHMDTQNAQRLKNEALLYNAFKTNGFCIEYQPKIDLSSGLIIGLEALVRIKTADGKIITPGNFIPLAEELNLIGEIDMHVLKLVCQECATLLREHDELKISVNLSATQLKKETLYDQYSDILDTYEVKHSSIHIELTESAIIENESVAYANLLNFVNSGFSIDLDDFGAGYASMSHFITYPFDTIKLDRGLVTSATDNPKGHALINAISNMARDLNLTLIAEGVETKKQLDLMKSLNIQYIQGYYFEKPRPLNDLIDKITQGIPYPID